MIRTHRCLISDPKLQPWGFVHRTPTWSVEDGGARGDAKPSRGRVLIVEDEHFLSIAAEHVLRSAGFEVVGIASSADQAIAAAQSERPDLVLMDIRLRGKRDGVEAAAEIFQQFQIYSLFASAYADQAIRARGEAAAAPLGWLPKPYTDAGLVAAVTRAMAQARERKQ